MRNIGLKKKKLFTLVASLIMLGFAVLLSVTTWSSDFSPSATARNQHSDAYYQRKEKLRVGTIAVENRTNSLEVVSVDKAIDQGFIVLALRNRYPRPITGYKFSVGDSIEYAERLNSKWVEPGGEAKEILPLQLGLDVKGIKILAVIFDDESTDGDPQFVREINDRREGARIQRRRSVRQLKEVINSVDFDLVSALSSLESELAPLSADQSRDLSADKVAGINSERYIVLQELNRISMPSAERAASGIELKSSAPDRNVRDGLKKFIEELSRRR